MNLLRGPVLLDLEFGKARRIPIVRGDLYLPVSPPMAALKDQVMVFPARLYPGAKIGFGRRPFRRKAQDRVGFSRAMAWLRTERRL